MCIDRGFNELCGCSIVSLSTDVRAVGRASSTQAQHSFAVQPREHRAGLGVLRLGVAQQFPERRLLPQWVQPGIFRECRITEKSTGHDAFQEIDRRTDFVEMREMTRRVE